MDKVFFALERMYRLTQIPVRFLDAQGDIALYARGYQTKEDPILSDNVLLQRLQASAHSSEAPVLEFEGETYLYGAFTNQMNHYIILGPVCLENITSTDLALYATKHWLNSPSFHIRHSSLGTFTSCLAMLYFATTGNCVTETEITLNVSRAEPEPPVQTGYPEYMMDSGEDTPRYDYTEELEILSLVENGESDALRELPREIVSGQAGESVTGSIKQLEYAVCIAIALSARAAIRGGLGPVTANTMSGLYRKRLENCRNPAEIRRLASEVLVGYAEQVQLARQARAKTSYIFKCKSYIYTHIAAPIHLKDIAREVGISEAHLSRLFSKSEGISISRYIQKVRVESAASIMRYSDASISAIAQYLCFSSQSYFGEVFKAHYGVTPQKYREKEKMVDF